MPEIDWSALITRGDHGYRLNEPASLAELDGAESALGARLPAGLRELYLVSDGVFDTRGQWFVIWPLSEVVARNLDAFAGEGASRSEYVGFGDDGTGDPFCTHRQGCQAV